MKDKFVIILMSALLTRILIFSASFGDALALLGLCGLFAYEKYLETKKEKPINEEVKEEILLLRTEISELKTNIGALKINQTFKR